MLDTLNEYYEEHNANIHRGVHRLAEEATALYEGSRERVAGFLGARTIRGLIFTRGTTGSINLVARTPAPKRAVVITKLDHARANYENALAAAQEAFGDKVLPLYLAADTPCTGLIGLLSQTHYEYSDGKRATTHAPDASYSDAIEELRGALIEGIIEESEDETLMERYLGGEEIDQSVLIDDLEKAVARGSFFPVVPACSGTGVGTLELLEIVTSGFPSPPEHQLPEVFTPQGKARNGLACDQNGPLLAEVVKTTSDPYVGRVSLVRVFSGTIRPDATVHVSGHFSQFFGSTASSARPRRLRFDGRPRRPRRGRAHRHAVVPARQAAAARAGRGGWRHLRDRQAEQGRNRRHAVR